MALTDMVLMPGDDYQAVCNELRQLDGSTDPIRSAQMSGKVADANNEISDQTRLLTLLENVLAEKAAGGGGGIDMDSFRDARVIGGVFNWTPSTIIFTEGMTWADFCDSPWNVGAYDNAGPIEELKPFLKVHNGRVIVNIGINPPRYLVRNDVTYAWGFYEEPQSDDVIVAPTDLIVSGVNYNTRCDQNWE